MKRLLVSAAILLSASTASASIALFDNGRNMKIAAYAVEGDIIHLTTPSGGQLSLPLTRIERIVDDEVATPEAVAEVKEIVKQAALPNRSWKFHEDSKPLFQSKYDDVIVEMARKHDVDAALVSAVIKAESDFNPKIVSHKGATGLMQLMPATAKRFGVKKIFDPKQNIEGGVRYLRTLLKMFDGNAELVLAAYNAGEGNVWKYEGVPPFKETVTYISRIGRHIRTAIDKKVIPASPVVSESEPASVTAAGFSR